MTDNNITGFQFGAKTYDRLKFTVQIVLPAVGVLYSTLAATWGWGHVEQVVGTIAALALFLGICLRVSSSNFDSGPDMGTPVGSFVVNEDTEGKKTVNLEFDQDPEEVVSGDHLVFKKKTVVPDVVFHKPTPKKKAAPRDKNVS